MRKMLVIAVREYQAAVRTKAFVISIVAMPVLMGGSIVVQLALKDRVDTADRRIAVVDHTGKLFQAIQQAAAKRNAEDIFKGEGQNRRQVAPRFIVESVEPFADEELAFDLSERVRREELLAFLVIGEDVIEPDPAAGETGQGAKLLYHSNRPLYDDFVKWASLPINDKVRELRLAALGLDKDTVDKATHWAQIENLGLVTKDDAGHLVEAVKTNEVANVIAPMGLMMLLFMVVMIGAQPLMHSVLEEKMQRIAEVLLACVPPFQLMMGKLVGMVAVALTLATVYLVGGFIAVHQSGYGYLFPSRLVWWFVVFMSLAVLMFGSLFAAIGAAVSDLKESQSMITPLMLIIVAPMFIWLNVVREPSSTFSLVASLIPPMTPMLMTLRQAAMPDLPIWQPLLGVGLVVVTTVLCVFAGGRIFRVGILMQGKGAKIGEMLRWVLRG